MIFCSLPPGTAEILLLGYISICGCHLYSFRIFRMFKVVFFKMQIFLELINILNLYFKKMLLPCLQNYAPPWVVLTQTDGFLVGNKHVTQILIIHWSLLPEFDIFRFQIIFTHHGLTVCTTEQFLLSLIVKWDYKYGPNNWIIIHLLTIRDHAQCPLKTWHWHLHSFKCDWNAIRTLTDANHPLCYGGIL